MLVARAPSPTAAPNKGQRLPLPPRSRVARGPGPKHLAPQEPQKLLAALEHQAQKHQAKQGPRSQLPPPPRELGPGGMLGRESDPARPVLCEAPTAKQFSAEVQGALTALASDTLQFWILWVSFTYIGCARPHTFISVSVKEACIEVGCVQMNSVALL